MYMFINKLASEINENFAKKALHKSHYGILIRASKQTTDF